MALYFDLEFYVPPEDQESKFKLKANPSNPDHILLGGSFFTGDLPAFFEPKKLQEIWIWNMKNFNKIDPKPAEEKLIQIINKIFSGVISTEGELKTVGVGQSRFDLQALFAKSLEFNIDSPDVLYRRFFSGFPIDLSLAGIGMVNEHPHGLEPVTANNLYKSFGINAEKGPGSNVWEIYEEGNYHLIEHRTKLEVECSVLLYESMAEELK